jgi:hypothetical protein
MSTEGNGTGGDLRLLREHWQSALGILIAGVATFAITFGGYQSYLDNGPLELDIPGATLTLLVWVAVGLASGFVSGRLRDAIGAWIAAMAGVIAAYVTFYVVLHPGAFFPGEGGFAGGLPSVGLFLAGFLTFGHWLGSYARVWVQEGEDDEPGPAAGAAARPAPTLTPAPPETPHEDAPEGP